MLGQWIDLPLDAVPWLYAADGPPTMASEQSFFLDVYAWYPYLHVFPPFLFPLSMHSLSHLYPRVCAFLSLSVKLFLPDQIESRKSLFAITFSRITGSRFQSNYIPFITNANTNSTSDNLLVAGSHPGPVSTVYLCNIMSAVIITSCQTTRALNGLKSMLLPFNLQFPLSSWPNRYLT